MKTTVALWSGLVLLTALLLSEDLPTDTSTLFAGSGRCESCHAAGTDPDGPMRDADGSDISPITLWRSTVMANAARDPIWQAKVAAEVADHPALQAIIEDKCTTCHTPMARTEAVFLGASGYSLAEAQTDPLALDGVSCTVCHQIQPANLGQTSSFSGEFEIDDSRVIYGPYEPVFAGAMQAAVNYAAAEGQHLSGSELCATCHTLFTPTIGNNGEIAGEIAEQTPYLEWLNSAYPNQGIECQTCHMPDADAATQISTIPSSVPERSPFSKHYFVGGNTMLLDMLRRNGESIGVTADSVLFDSTLARTRSQLRGRTAELSATYAWPHPDTVEITVTVRNRAGHKLPTGFPSRRVWLNVSIAETGESVVFESGRWNPATGDIDHIDGPFEPHHDVITSGEQVVIYQSLMGDVDGNLTWKLLRGASYLKDNRLPPEGFTSDGPAYDTTAVQGVAQADPNFNRVGGSEGSGSDQVFFRVGGLSQTSTYTFSARLLYQALSRSFVDDLKKYTGPEVDRFVQYYDAIDETPVTVDSTGLTITATGVSTTRATQLYVESFPNPATGVVYFQVEKPIEEAVVHVYDLVGRRVAEFELGFGTNMTVPFDTRTLVDGIYIYRVTSGNSRATGRIVLLR